MHRVGWSRGLVASVVFGPLLHAAVGMVTTLRALPLWLAHRRPPRVLLVTEFAPYAGLLARTLRRGRYRPERCHPRAALAAVATGKYGVVVSGLALPGLTGLSLLAAVAGSSPRTQVILLTSDPSGELALRALRAGALAVLGMQAVEELGRWVSEALARVPVRRPARRPIGRLPSARDRTA
jgi:DNA-binding NtrC family response regulator